MTQAKPARQLLQVVRRRLFWDGTVRRSCRLLFAAAALYAVGLLVSRLTAYIPNWFTPWTILAPVGLAVLGAALWRVRVSLQDAARAADAAAGAPDLFLTYTLLPTSAGEFQPLVDRDADALAARIRPETAVPWNWAPPLRPVLGVLAVLLCGALFLPQFDPFGKQAEAEVAAKIVRKLEQERKHTEIRKAQLKERDGDENHSEDVTEGIQGLQQQLQAMRKGELKANFEKLVVSQKLLGDKFRAVNGALKQLMQSGSLDQKFGGQHASEMKKWQQDLQQGGGGSLSQELEQLRQDLEQLVREEDPVKKTEIRRKLERRLNTIRDFARERSGSKSLSAALERAQEQLDAAKDNSQLAPQALEGMRESLDLAQMEVASLAQAARDLQALEEALETIALAKQLNADGDLDGELVDTLTALEEYKEMYEQLLAESGSEEGDGADGDGGGDEGQGNGRAMEEDDSVETDFVPEKSKSPVTQGKILLSMKTKGIGETGELQEQRQQALDAVKQAYAEAIDAEQIPPGYHEGIKSYFNALDTRILDGPAPSSVNAAAENAALPGEGAAPAHSSDLPSAPASDGAAPSGATGAGDAAQAGAGASDAALAPANAEP